tara:strand:- start:170 stop:622 length:453 start_codon:yes stop_codon:yes gene_type:complete
MKLFYIFFVILILSGCINSNKTNITSDLVQIPITTDRSINKIFMPKLELNRDSFDFGEIKQNESVIVEFILKNVGNAPLIIRSVKASCGCTVIDWPSEPIMDGDDTIIKVTFNSGERRGAQTKTVSLITNAVPSIKVLKITGTVLVTKNN